ncbi:MAG: hypothetical protein ACWGQW_05335 [bacterium]
MSRKDREEKPYLYKCPYCKQLFYTREATVEHMNASHQRAMQGDPPKKEKKVDPFSDMGGRW